MRSLEEADVRGKRVLVRVDFNVPLKKGRVADDERIRAALPTIKFLIKKKAKIVLVSHLGRPDGKVVNSLSLKPVVARLSKLLGKKVLFDSKKELSIGDVLLLENLRFDKGEEANSVQFARRLASLAEVYVNDAFAVSHRAHASVEAVTRFLPSFAGFLLLKEVRVLSDLLKNPKRPFIAVIGGIKISTKISVIENLLKKVDAVLIGSAMACAFFQATGHEAGKGSFNKEDVRLAKFLLRKARKKIFLPTDLVVASSVKSSARVVQSGSIPKNVFAFDIGPETIAVYSEIINSAGTVFWNGPPGFFEVKKFSRGTIKIAHAVSACRGVSVIGGGDTLDAAKKLKFTHVSTGGGASLTLLSGKKLPAIEALR